MTVDRSLETIYLNHPLNLINLSSDMQLLKDIRESLLHIAFPHICAGCGTDILGKENPICLHCLSSLPQTSFSLFHNNPVEKIFWGRLPIAGASSQYYFTKESLIQRLLHQFKYRGNKELGYYLGNLMGHSLKESNKFSTVEALIPLPLFPDKERQRGYNQATILCNGIADVMHIPVLKNVVTRPVPTETQTKKTRVERWQNMEGRFELSNNDAIKNKHLLLVDDVITTGATLEACGKTLLEAENIQLSIAALCYSAS